MEVPWSELPDLTLLIKRSRAGDKHAEDRLFQLAYPHLRKAAVGLLGRKSADMTYTPQDLLHAVYVERLRGWKGAVNDRGHYLKVVKTAMKQELIDRARRAQTQRRTAPSAGFPQASATTLSLEEVLALEREIERLEKIDPRAAHVVRLRYYCGCSWEQTAEAVGATVKMVRDDWESAAKWLRKRLGGKSSA